MERAQCKPAFYFSLRYCLLSGLLLFALTAFSQPPAIQYGFYKIFTKDSAIKLLRPLNTGGMVPQNIYGQTTTIAGNGIAGFADAAGSSASFNRPSGIAIDATGNIYVADALNNRIRKISPDGLVSTLAGNGMVGSTNSNDGRQASFNGPCGIAADAAGNIYVADCFNHKIRKILPSGAVTTFAGSGVPGDADDKGTFARFDYPVAVAVDETGNVYVSDEGNNKIRKITVAGVVSTLAGSGSIGATDNSRGNLASFNQPAGIVVDAHGNVYVADQLNHKIRKITPSGAVSTFAGSGLAGSLNNAIGTLASFNNPRGIAADGAGNIYVGDVGNQQIRKVTPDGGVYAFAGSGATGSLDNDNGLLAGFYFPNDVETDHSGNVFVADCLNHKIRKIETKGYSITPDILPEGLHFDRTTGIFSGTPSQFSAGILHTITAYNQYGSSSAVLGIAVSPQPGNALDFDGFDDLVTVPDAPSLHSKVITVEMWVMLKNGGEGRFLVKRNDKYSYDESYSLGIDSSGCFRAVMSSGTGLPESQRKTVQLEKAEQGRWYFLAGIFAPDSVSLYVNGVLKSSVVTGFPVSDGVNSMTLGFDQRLAFEADEARVFNTSRKENIAVDMMNTLSPETPGLVAYYNFNLGIAGGKNEAYTTLIDLSPYHNHGRLNHFLSLSGNTSNWVESYAMVVPVAEEAADITSTSFTARWARSLLGEAEKYILEVSTDATFKTFVPGYHNLEIAATSQAVTGLQPNTIYYYRVRSNKHSVEGQGVNSATVKVATTH